MKPTVGRIVHFHHGLPNGSVVTLAAIVVKAFTETCVNLQVFNDGYTEFAGGTPSVALFTSVCQGGPQTPHTWSWPPRDA